jgi:uncharacterized membrane protein YGL010W
MKTLDEWFELYGVSHKNPTNVKIHKVCVPLIMMSLLGMLWSIPVPMDLPFYLNFSTLFILLCLVFYALLDIKVMLFMLLQSALMLVAVYYGSLSGKLLSTSIVVFVLAWVGQFVGHKIEGAKPSFFEDLQFLLIGPVWIFPFFKK